jgi:hypothetical protein
MDRDHYGVRMNTFAWRIRKWYLSVRLNLLKRKVRSLRRSFFRNRRRHRFQQLQLPFRG